MTRSPALTDGPVPPELLSEIVAQSSRPVPEVLDPLVRLLQDRFGDSLRSVLLYGSCLHAGDPTEGIVDLYAVVSDYRAAFSAGVLRWFNTLLPPNVFYAEVTEGGVTLRAKYAVLSAADFSDGATRWFHSYVWARFAQPARVLYARDADALSLVHRTLAHAVLTFLGNALPTLAGEDVGAEEVWTRGLSLTYASELRPEGAARVRWLTERNLPDYARLTEAAAPALGPLLRHTQGGRWLATATSADRRRSLRRWRVRRWQGKLLSVLRLGKSIFTFAGGVDYVAWKVHRHTGVVVEVTPSMRRHPILVAPWKLLWLLRRGIVR